MAKPVTTFPEFVYTIIAVSYVFTSNSSLNCLNLWLLFFCRFPYGKSAAYKKLPY